MDVRAALKSQYHGAVKTLREVIENCADSMWNDPADGPARFWRIAYHRGDLLGYVGECDWMIDAGVDALDLSATQCGFPWYRMPTLEHQIVNIRHIQHHAAILSSRLRRSAGNAIDCGRQGVIVSLGL